MSSKSPTNYSFLKKTYTISNSARKDSFDDNSSASAADDSKAKTASIIDEVYYFYLCPLGIQLKECMNGSEQIGLNLFLKTNKFL